MGTQGKLSKNLRAGLDAAIEAAGSVTELARRIGVSSQAISQWSRVPPSRIIEIEDATSVPREVLRPDLYRQGAE